MTSTQHINIDISQRYMTPEQCVYVKQLDQNSRIVTATLYDQGSKITQSGTCKIYFEGRGDNPAVYINGSISNGLCTFTIPQNAIQVPGKMRAEIQIVGTNDEILTSATFYIYVDNQVNPSGSIAGGGGIEPVSNEISKHNTDPDAHEDIREKFENLDAVNRITLDAPLSVDSSGKQLTVKITYYGGDDPSPVIATQVLSSTYHDANCIRYINLSHDLDAGEVVNATADQDPEGWTSIANITIANGMWQLSSVIWLDDILFHNADENAHPALKEHSDSAIAAHNTNSEAHADIRAEIEDMHAVNRIRLDAPLSVGVSGHYVRVLHRPPAGQELETIRFGLNGPIPEGAKKLVVWMKADRPLAAGVVALWLRTTPDANGGTTAQYPLEVGAEWAKLEIDLTALESKTGYQSMMFVIDSANSATADTSIYFDQISYIMEDGSTQMLYSFDDLTPTNYAPPQYAYGADGCNFYGVQAIGCVNVGTIDQSAGWMWHGEIEVMDKEDPAPDTGKYLTVKASYYCGDNSSLVTAEKTFLSTDCDFGLQYINLSHDPDAEELASVTSTRDPAGWTSIAVIQILNDMWQLPSVIWLDDVLYHDQSETAHADIRKELEAVGDDISAQIATHNNSLSAHPYIKQNTGEQIRGHNLSPSAHADIRQELENLAAAIRALGGDV